jgi:DNA-binding NarL/FixJ family response regulator/tRNA A-37 threonylcarbamoyl transferase component Bud32
MSVYFLIIDGNAKFRAKLTQLLQAEWTGAGVDEYDPAVRGFPGDDMRWSKYDLLFIDYSLRADNGLEWYEVLKRQPDFPPTVILSAQPDPEIAVRAIKAGAENYLPKNSLTRERLKEVVREILGRLHRRSAPEARDERPAQQAEDKARVIHVAKTDSMQPPDFWPEIAGHVMLKKIGQGGMSNVYLGERLSDRTPVVVKTLAVNLMDNKKTVARANQEFKLISRVKNPHIVKLYDQGTIGDMLYTTMEYFPKGDLKQRLRKGINQREALAYLKQIANGLSGIHGCGIIHRDLKPGNIMFRDDGSLAIIDFGISKDINSDLDLTNPGQIMGTPNYMAPEQGSSNYKPDARSDIYSLGVMLYEMLTGKKPYAAPSGAAIIYKHIHDPIPTLPNQFFEIQPLIDKMMAKFPQQRFPTAYDLMEHIDKEFRWDITLDFK